MDVGNGVELEAPISAYLVKWDRVVTNELGEAPGELGKVTHFPSVAL